MYLQTHMPTSHMHAHMGTGAHTYERERELITHVSVYSRIFCKGEEFISILLKTATFELPIKGNSTNSSLIHQMHKYIQPFLPGLFIPVCPQQSSVATQ